MSGHSTLDPDHPYIFIDSCMQAWPDADFASAHRHGVTAYGVTAWRPHAGLDTALEELMFWHLVVRRHPTLRLALSVDDIRDAKQRGQAALILSAQDGDWIGFKLHRIEAFYRLGLRVMLPAYNRTNQICGGILDREDVGLTRFGERVVEECNRVGIVLDCTHIGRRASLDVIDRSALPCIFSHSNPSALAPNPRNIDDEQIRACIARDGVVGLVAWGPLVMRPNTTHQPTVDEFIAMIDRVAQMAGDTAHIGIGTDMSLGTYPDHEHDPWGEPAYPSASDAYGRLVTPDIRSPKRSLDGFSDYAEIVTVIERLLARGYTEDDVRQILGENYLRVYSAVWGEHS